MHSLESGFKKIKNKRGKTKKNTLLIQIALLFQLYTVTLKPFQQFPRLVHFNRNMNKSLNYGDVPYHFHDKSVALLSLQSSRVNTHAKLLKQCWTDSLTNAVSILEHC